MELSVDPTVIQSVSGGNVFELVVMGSSAQSSSMISVVCVEETIPAAQKSWEPLQKRGNTLE